VATSAFSAKAAELSTMSAHQMVEDRHIEKATNLPNWIILKKNLQNNELR
jgi:hypothetical protein